VSIERTYHCDGPAGTLPNTESMTRCPGHASTAADPPHVPFGFLTVLQGGESGGTELHFCTWDCLLRFAAAREPVEFILPDAGETS
jgi:hypothetical protein